MSFKKKPEKDQSVKVLTLITTLLSNRIHRCVSPMLTIFWRAASTEGWAAQQRVCGSQAPRRQEWSNHGEQRRDEILAPLDGAATPDRDGANRPGSGAGGPLKDQGREERWLRHTNV